MIRAIETRAETSITEELLVRTTEMRHPHIRKIQDASKSGDEHGESHSKRIDNDWLAEMTKNEKLNAFKPLGLQNIDTKIGHQQAYWIKYRTWSYKKMRKKKKTFVKVEDFKVYYCEIQDVVR